MVILKYEKGDPRLFTLTDLGMAIGLSPGGIWWRVRIAETIPPPQVRRGAAGENTTTRPCSVPSWPRKRRE